MSEFIKAYTPADLAPEKLNTAGKVLVDFWAPWCGPCRMVGPILEEIAEERQNSLTVAKVNIDDYSSAAVRLGIQSIPTMILFENGVEVDRMIGAYPKDVILEMVDKQ